MRENRLTLIALSISAGVLFGYDAGVMSWAILYLQQDSPLLMHNAWLLIAALLCGALTGTMLCGRLCDRWGRKKNLLLAAILFFCGSLASFYSQNLLSLLAARFILGVAIGMASLTTPLYLAETSTKHQRYRLVALNQVAISFGLMFAYLCHYYYSATPHWRMMFFSGIYPATVFFFSVVMLPESPRYLMQKGQSLKARLLAQRFAIDDELSDIKRLPTVRPWQVQLKQGSVRVALLTAVMVVISSQLSGINTVIYSAPTLLHMAGFGHVSATMSMLFIGATNGFIALLALPLVDKCCRRTLLCIGFSLMGASLLSLAYVFHAPLNTFPQQMVCVLSLLLYIQAFVSCICPTVFIIVTEAFVQTMRATGMSIALSVYWLINMLLAAVFFGLLKSFGASAVFMLLALMCACSIGYVLQCIPEVRRLSLEELDQKLHAT